MRVSIILIGLGLVLGLPTSGQAVDPTVKCSAAKEKEAGKYSICRLKAETKAIKKNELPDFSKCKSKFSEKWQKAESKAEGACASNGDEAAIQAQVTQFVDDLVAALGPCPRVEGHRVGGACWYLSGPGESCDTACGNVGLVYDTATETYAGSGGTLANCDAVMTPSPFMESPVDESCSDGVGCAIDSQNTFLKRCTDPPTTSSAASPTVVRFCACQ